MPSGNIVNEDPRVGAASVSRLRRTFGACRARQTVKCPIVAVVLVGAALFAAPPVQCREPQPDPMDVSHGGIVPAGGSAEERLHSLEEKYSTLQQEYAKRTEALTVALSQLADVMKRLEDSRAWREANTIIQTDDKNVRGLLSAAEGQLQSMAMLRQQCEKEFSVVKVQSEERAALLAVAAEELRQGNADKAVSIQAASERSAEAVALRVKIELLETKLASVQAQVLSLQRDQEQQAEIKRQLVQKVKESVSRLMDLQSRHNPRGESPSRPGVVPSE